MDRRYRRPDNVNVYATALDKANGLAPVKVVHVVPYTLFGLDYYLVDDLMYPGYQDPRADGCVFLDRPMPNTAFMRSPT